MREALLALAIFAGLSGAGLVVRLAAWTHLVRGGLVLLAVGLLVSVPCAVRYHLALYRALAPRQALDRRWIWNPTGHHDRLTERERDAVLPWFWGGAAGWSASVLGCILTGLGLWLSSRGT